MSDRWIKIPTQIFPLVEAPVKVSAIIALPPGSRGNTRVCLSGGDFFITPWTPEQVRAEMGRREGRSATVDEPEAFTVWYDTIWGGPKKGRKAACRAWLAAERAGVLPALPVLRDAMQALVRERHAKSAAKDFVPEWCLPGTYINGCRWADHCETKATRSELAERLAALVD